MEHISARNLLFICNVTTQTTTQTITRHDM